MEHLLTPDAPLVQAEYKIVALTIPANVDLERYIWGAIAGISFFTSWKQSGTMPPEDAAQYIKEVLASRRELDFMIGQVVTYINDSLPDNVLKLDGGTYAKADYPLLYDALPASLKSPLDFTLPDVRGAFLLGASVDYALLSSGGEAEHQLTVGEMPSHSHTNFPHSHSESGATFAPNEIGVGVPTPTAIPTTTVTGGSSVDIDPTGGDEPHNNMPPFFVVNYGIIAKV